MQPFVVIFIIPVSFIGLFLTFYLFRLNFDQGGFAAFVLLAALSVNANIYVLNTRSDNTMLYQYSLPEFKCIYKGGKKWRRKQD